MELKESQFEQTQRLRIRFIKKKGDLASWYDLFNEMKETVFEGVLLAPRVHHETIVLAEGLEEPVRNPQSLFQMPKQEAPRISLAPQVVQLPKKMEFTHLNNLVSEWKQILS